MTRNPRRLHLNAFLMSVGHHEASWRLPESDPYAGWSVKHYQELQDILGDLQDGVVAAEVIRRIAAGTAGRHDENGFTYGLLFANEIHRSEASRAQARSWKRPQL